MKNILTCLLVFCITLVYSQTKNPQRGNSEDNSNLSNFITIEKPKNITSSAMSNMVTFDIRKKTNDSYENSSEKRVAMVIGNSRYVHSAPLRNPVNDAKDMARTLTRIGFDVTQMTDANYKRMHHGLKQFETKIRDADIVLYYFAGHGIQVDGHNYLIPVDAKLNQKSHIKYETIDVSMVTRIMELSSNKKRLNMVILDACRNNPFRSWSRGGNDGLVKVDPPNGTLIAYATSPNSVASDGTGKNGLYTGELIKQLLTPQRIEDVFINTRISVEEATNFQQSPWEQAKLRGAFYLVK